MPKVTINLDKEEIKVLNAKAKKNLLSLTEHIENIIRLSVLRSKKRTYATIKTDDKLIGIFSRERKGRKKIKKTKKK